MAKKIRKTTKRSSRVASKRVEQMPRHKGKKPVPRKAMKNAKRMGY